MAGSIHTEAYQMLLRHLIERRISSGLSQSKLAERLGKPASFVGKYELGERRLDVLELAVILRALNTDMPTFWQSIALDVPERL